MKDISIIRKMFYGEMGTFEQIKLSEEYKKAEKKMCEAVDIFLENLTPKQKELFDEAYIHIIDRNAEYAIDHFTEGFKFGLLLGIEVAKEKD